MNIEELYESGERKIDRSHFRNLVMIAKADGEISPDERKMLDRIGAHIGLSPDQILGIIKNPKQFSSNTPYNHEERFEQMVDLLPQDGIVGRLYRVVAGRIFTFGYRMNLRVRRRGSFGAIRGNSERFEV